MATTGLFNTDTIVERITGIGPLNVGDRGTVDIELVALSLVSVSPITIGGVDFDVKIESGSLLNTPGPFFRDAAIPSSPVHENGMTIFHVGRSLHVAGGNGTFGKHVG